MTEVKYQDEGGHSMILVNASGRHLVPESTQEQWNAITSITTRPDDIFICAYPKSGFHWLWEITSMLRSGNATPIKDLMEFHILDFVPEDKLSFLEEQPSPRTFTTHRYPDELPKMALQQKCKIVYLLRDPKDICVSYFHHLTLVKSLDYDGQFKDFIRLFLDGKVPFDSWCDHIKQWHDFREVRPDQPFTIVYYEDMKKDPINEIKRLAVFLEVNASDDLITNIAINTNFTTMKSAKESLENVFCVYYKTGKEIMYRKGETGDWKNWFSESESRDFDESIKSKLKGIKYQSQIGTTRFTCF